MVSLNRFRIYLTRLEVFPGWDAWTLIPVALAAIAFAVVLAYYAYSVYSRSRSAEGIDWGLELGTNRTWVSRVDMRNPFHRLLMTCFAVLIIGIGAHAIWTGHFTSYEVGRHSHGGPYSTDGAPAVAAGIILCIVGVILGIIGVFGNSESMR